MSEVLAPYKALETGQTVEVVGAGYLSGDWHVNDLVERVQVESVQIQIGVILQDIEADKEWLIIAHDNEWIKRAFYVVDKSVEEVAGKKVFIKL